MTALELLKGLADYLKDVNKNYRLTDDEVKDNELICRPGYLKVRESEREKFYPHIVPRFLSESDEEDGTSSVKVRIFFGTYCNDPDTGWMELYNLMEASRIGLLTQRNIANRFRLVLPLTVAVVEPAPYPQWLGYIDVTYSIAQPREELNI